MKKFVPLSLLFAAFAKASVAGALLCGSPQPTLSVNVDAPPARAQSNAYVATPSVSASGSLASNSCRRSAARVRTPVNSVINAVASGVVADASAQISARGTPSASSRGRTPRSRRLSGSVRPSALNVPAQLDATGEVATPRAKTPSPRSRVMDPSAASGDTPAH
jgi:hypothetical protein